MRRSKKIWHIGMAVFTVCFATWLLYDVLVAPKKSLTQQDGFSRASVANDADLNLDDGSGYGDFEAIQAKDGAVSWDVFAAVKEIERQQPDPTDSKMVMYTLEPQFTPAMRALNGKTVRLMGYMFPLDPAEEQSKFLFGPYPPSCGFHYHVNNNQVVEVVAQSPITFTWKPIAIEGTLNLLEKDEYNVFYRMKNATLKQSY